MQLRVCFLLDISLSCDYYGLLYICYSRSVILVLYSLFLEGYGSVKGFGIGSLVGYHPWGLLVGNQAFGLNVG